MAGVQTESVADTRWIKEENALPVYFVLGASLEGVCPFGDGEETWETWGVYEESHHPEQIDGVWYRSSAYGVGGTNVEIGTWIPLYLAGQLTVISVEQFAAIQAANSPQLP